MIDLVCSYMLVQWTKWQNYKDSVKRKSRQLFDDGGCYHIETSPLICGANDNDNGLRHERVNSR